MTDKFVLDSSKLRKQILLEAKKTWKPSMSEKESAEHLVDVCLRVCEERDRRAVEELKKKLLAELPRLIDCQAEDELGETYFHGVSQTKVEELVNSVFKFAEKEGK